MTGVAPTSSPAPSDALAARFGAAATSDAVARAACAIAGAAPALVVRPGDPAELAAVVGSVAAAGGALVALGRGAHRALGHAPCRYDVALVTDRLTRVRDYTPADMTVTVEAGLPFADLQALLAAEGQWLPLEPPLPAATTIGGLVAADLGGPLVTSQGRVRDFVIGIGVVTADGVAARAGGRVVKNVAGYDLMKLFVGSLGTLAVVTDVTFKVRPQLERRRTLVAACRTVSAACAFAAEIETTRSAMLAATVVTDLEADEPPAEVVVRLGGAAADVDVAAERVRVLAATHAAVPTLQGDDADPALAAAIARTRDAVRDDAASLVIRMIALPGGVPSLMPDVLAATAGSRGNLYCDPSRGVLVLALTTATPAVLLERVRGVASTHAARTIIEGAPAELAATIDVWHPLPAAWPLMRRVKDALDPRGVLAPGRFVGRL